MKKSFYFDIIKLKYLKENMNRKKIELILTASLLPLDLLMILAAYWLAYFLRVETMSYLYVLPFKNFLLFSAAFLPVWVIVFGLLGLYNLKIHQQPIKEFLLIILGSSAVFMFILGFLFLTRTLFFSRLIILYAWLLSAVLTTLGRNLFRLIQSYLYAKNIGIKKVALIGNGNGFEEFIKLSNSPGSDFKIVIYLTKDELSKAKNLIHQGRVDEIIQIDPKIDHRDLLEVANECDEHQVSFKFVPSYFETISTNVDVSFLNSIPLIEIKPTPLDGWGRIVKRIIDIIFSGLVLTLSIPCFIIISPLIKITSPGGPVFLRQKRIGRDGKEFELFKFRSMIPEAEKISRWTTKNDRRITPFGEFLRKTNLDEIPQFINVFLGDMSVVGPRPEQPLFVAEFSQKYPAYFKRHKVKSGITGWAQVNGLRGDTSISKRLKYDLYYIENWSLAFDLNIMLKTALIILKGTQ